MEKNKIIIIKLNKFWHSVICLQGIVGVFILMYTTSLSDTIRDVPILYLLLGLVLLINGIIITTATDTN